MLEKIVAIPVGTSLFDAEKMMILATLESVGGDKVVTAAILKVTLKTIYNKLQVYNRKRPI